MTAGADVGHSSSTGHAPLVFAGTIPLVVLVALPWHDHRLATIPGFAPLWLGVLLVCELLTVLLLFSSYRAGGSPRLLALSWAYLWAAGAALQIAFAYPGVLRASPSFAADANSMEWLWVSWHVVPPILIAIALAPWPHRLERLLAPRRGRELKATLSWISVGVLTLLFSLLIDRHPEWLPTITAGAAPRVVPAGLIAIVLLNLAALALSVWGVATRPGSDGLERWAVVAAVAFLGDVWITAQFPDRFTVAWYLARLLGLAASALVMVAILRDKAQLQIRTSETAHRLEERNAELLEATRLREHLIAVVSHDMRTPLAGLQGYLEMLRDDDLESPLARRMLERSWMLTRRLTLLTEDLLAAATSEHGDLVVNPELLDLSQQLGECASCFPDLDLELECPPGLAAYADPLRLQQILANLVRNAQKHGAEPVVIAAASQPDQPGGVVVRVSDAGPGVPASYVPQLFEPYSQGPSTAAGSGLGLSVVRDLVSAHHGTIHYESAGNAFVLTLPPASVHRTVPFGDAPDRLPHETSDTATESRQP